MASNKLFTLIKTLTPSEKGYFKKASSLHSTEEKNNYILLFEAIDKQEVYDEKKIVKQFSGEKFARRMAVAKAYLYDMILKSMRSYYSDILLEHRIKCQTMDAKFLLKKGLYDQCISLIEKTQNAAIKHEKFLYALECISIKRSAMRKNSYADTTEQQLQQLADERRDALKKIANIEEYTHLMNSINFLFVKSGPARNDEQRKKYDQVMRHPLLKDEKEALTITGKSSFNYIHALYTGAYTGASSFKYNKRILEIEESAPHMLEEEPLNYIAILFNLCIGYIQQKDDKNTLELITKMRMFSESHKMKKDFELEIKIFERSYYAEVTLYKELGTYDKALTIINDIDTGLKKYGGKINQTLEQLILYNISYCYFGIRDYKRALEWLNRLLLRSDSNTREDLACFTRIFMLIVHYELGKQDLLEYSVKSTYRFLLKRNRLYKIENIILSFIRLKMPKLDSKTSLINAFKNLKKEIEDATNNSFETRALDFFDFISWLESKIENRTFAEIVKKKIPAGKPMK